MTRVERFYTRFFPVTESGCWIWMGYLTDGYGCFGRERAHRFSWALVNGPIPDGLNICHHCDIRCCVNPDHLYAATQQTNIMHAVQRGRVIPPRSPRYTDFEWVLT